MRLHRVIFAMIFAMLAMPLAVMPVVADAPANEFFQQTWARTDKPIADGQANRTWMWGPEAFTGAMTESYVESPNGERTVQYFDKARMEITHPQSVGSDSIWYVTNGLLVVELITGEMQVGDNDFETRSPAQVNVAGDADDPTGPTYATFSTALDATPTPVGTTITKRIDQAGTVTDDPTLAARGVTAGHLDEVTNHTIATPFWDFMNANGLVWQDGSYSNAKLFENPYFATGRPVTEAYWANVKVAGDYQDVLLQCFERRCLTYTPENDPGWQVEAGNVGQHYYAWRYERPAPEPNVIHLSGSGTTLSDPFDLQEGLVVATGNHDGESNFIAWLVNTSTGEDTALLANEIGVVDSSSRAAVVRESGQYAIEVNADGNWSLEIRQPSPTTSEVASTPWELSGSGNQVFYFLQLDQGLHKAIASHNGESNFIVEAYPTRGDFLFSDLVFNEIGQVTDITAGVQVRADSAGPYLISIQADGAWTIRIE